MIHSLVCPFKKFLLTGFLVFSALLLVACGGGVAGDNKNFIVVKDQMLSHLSEVVIESVTAERDVIIVVYESKDGGALEQTKSDVILGSEAISAGDVGNVAVSLNRKTRPNETLFAELWADNGAVGTLESNGVDTVISQAAVSAVSFIVSHRTVHLEVVGDEQGRYAPLNREQVMLKEVIVDASSWLVVHRNNPVERGDVMGFKLLKKGYHSDVKIGLITVGKKLKPMSDGDKVIVAVYRDTDGDEAFDLLQDELVSLNDESVQLFLDIVL